MIYFDNAATTRPDCACLEKAKQYLYDSYYNPSALYAEGYNMHRELESARSNILRLVANERDYCLVFTSCGTEADNLAVLSGAKRGNVVTTLSEHSAVYNSAKSLKERGIEVRFAPLNSDGSVKIDQLLKLIDGNTSLVSVIHANNETGAVNDINAIAKAVKGINGRALFHADGVQAFCKIPYHMSNDVDLYSVSAHKIGALKGTGALIKKKSVQLKPLIYGGGQEQNLRSGTENVFGIKAFEFAALKRYPEITDNYRRIKRLNEKMRELLDRGLFTVISGENASPYILAVVAHGVRGEIILHEVNDEGVIIGTGSACSSNEKRRYSRVILACGIEEVAADGVLRLSFSPETTEEEIIAAAKILNQTVKRQSEIMK